VEGGVTPGTELEDVLEDELDNKLVDDDELAVDVDVELEAVVVVVAGAVYTTQEQAELKAETSLQFLKAVGTAAAAVVVAARNPGQKLCALAEYRLSNRLL
jgi:hypothetical protein